MKAGVFDAILGNMALEPAASYLRSIGAEAIEIATGGYPIGLKEGSARCNTPLLIESDTARDEFLGILSDSKLPISALSCHGNPLHPNRKTADIFRLAYHRSVDLAKKIGVGTVITFSGLPGETCGSCPAWVSAPWPSEQYDLWRWQFEQEKAYWKDALKFAADHGIRVAWELHPNMFAHNARTFLRLVEAIGADNLGVNLDFSHFMWRGIDPLKVIETLKPWIYHVHGKDCLVNESIAEVHGIIDETPFDKPEERAWRFCTMGVGHSKDEWLRIMQALRMAGYDGTVSLEHEDALMSADQGLEQGLRFLFSIVLRDPPGENAWTK